MKIKTHILWIVLIWILLCVFWRRISTEAWMISLEIIGLGVRHWTPENFQINTVYSSPSEQYIEQQFTENFWVEDLQWYATGYYTTIQCDGIYGPLNTKLTWIELKAGDSDPELIAWLTWPNVAINSALSSYMNIVEPVTYIYKNNGANNIGLVNKYGDKPRLKITIPPTAQPGIYSGTIVFSFYMN